MPLFEAPETLFSVKNEQFCSSTSDENGGHLCGRRFLGVVRGDPCAAIGTDQRC